MSRNISEVPNVSVITWDGSFRDSFHTISFFAQQTYPKEKFEFIWVDYYEAENVKRELPVVKNIQLRVIALNCAKSDQWHVAKCLNQGVSQCKGDLLIIIDGDIVVENDFIQLVVQDYKFQKDVVTYYRRWDEKKGTFDINLSRTSIDYLRKNCYLDNPTNYGGCLVIPKKLFEFVGGYDEHDIFSGPGAVSKELATRLVNAGIPVRWHENIKIYHPWHSGTLPSIYSKKQELQRHVIQCRYKNLDYKADSDQTEMYTSAFKFTYVEILLIYIKHWLSVLTKKIK